MLNINSKWMRKITSKLMLKITSKLMLKISSKLMLKVSLKMMLKTSSKLMLKINYKLMLTISPKLMLKISSKLMLNVAQEVQSACIRFMMELGVRCVLLLVAFGRINMSIDDDTLHVRTCRQTDCASSTATNQNYHNVPLRGIPCLGNCVCILIRCDL